MWLKNLQTKVHFAETAEMFVFVDTFYYHQVEDWFEVFFMLVFFCVSDSDERGIHIHL